MPKFAVSRLAELTGGRVVGPTDVTVADVCELDSAGPGELAFLRDRKKAEAARHCRASVLITPVEVAGFAGTQIVCEDAEVAMAAVLSALAAERFPRPEGISGRASVSPSARLGRGVSVGDYAVIGEEAVIGDGAVIYPLAYVGPRCRIGACTVLHAHASVHECCVIGDDCIIHYNAVIGAEGFGFVQRDGRNVKIPQVGTVQIGNNVEIGAVSTVDRATLGATVIEDGCKVDNHCHIAHNCRVGPDCIIVGGAKLAGSVRLGRGVIVAEEAGISDHVTVGDGAILGARCGVASDVPAGAVLLGEPARPIGEQRRIFALTGRLPQMAERLRQVERDLAALKARLDAPP
jgi:UDP-3-O-[3-hydroxymyristoyl] glucosamine N-acyltransferase